jgi:hypothetical protein
VASQLAFRVRVNGADLPAYRNRRFMAKLPPGETRELRLYDFWTSETARPAAADGGVTVEVSLAGATWYTIERDGGREVWTPIGAVAGLPVQAMSAAGH